MASTKPPHPHVSARGTRSEINAQPGVHAITYSPVDERARWIKNELARENAMTQVGRSVEQVVAALVEDPAPRPQLLVIDVDALSAGELFHLHAIREHGWCGTIVALGKVPPQLRASLGIDTVIAPPFVNSALDEVIAKHRHETTAQTTQIPTLRDLRDLRDA